MKKKKIILDEEEKEILEAFEKGKLKSVPKVKKEIKRAQKIASNTLRKDARINIRLASNDLSNLKQMAAYQGLPYQTLIASILHRYAAGHLRSIEKHL